MLPILGGSHDTRDLCSKLDLIIPDGHPELG